MAGKAGFKTVDTSAEELEEINSKIKDNFLSLHPIWHFASRMQFSFILPVRNVCVNKMDYWFRECAVTGVTAVTI